MADPMTPAEAQEFRSYLNPDAPAPLKAVDAGELLTMVFEPRDYILHPLLPTQGTAMIYGPRGCGKTFVSIAIGCAVAAGARFLKWSAPKPRKVLYCDGEMPGVAMRDRLAAIIAGMEGEIEPGFFRLITPDLQSQGIPNLSGTVGQTLVEDKLEGGELLIVDSISTLCRSGRENEAESWTGVQEWVLSLRRRGVSTLFDHHSGKGGAQRGTSRREDILDTVIALRRPADYHPNEGCRFEVHYEKARNVYGPDVEPFEVRLETKDGAAIWVANALENVTEAKATILFADGLSVREVAEELGISKSKAGRLRARLEG